MQQANILFKETGAYNPFRDMTDLQVRNEGMGERERLLNKYF